MHFTTTVFSPPNSVPLPLGTERIRPVVSMVGGWDSSTNVRGHPCRQELWAPLTRRSKRRNRRPNLKPNLPAPVEPPVFLTVHHFLGHRIRPTRIVFVYPLQLTASSWPTQPPFRGRLRTRLSNQRWPPKIPSALASSSDRPRLTFRMTSRIPRYSGRFARHIPTRIGRGPPPQLTATPAFCRKRGGCLRNE